MLDIALVAGTLGAFGAALWYAITANQQLTTMREQTGQLQRQTEVALEAVVQKQFRVTGTPQKPYLSIVLTNRGKVSAATIKANLEIYRTHLPEGSLVGEKVSDWQFEIPEIIPSVDTVSERGIYLEPRLIPPQTSPNISKAVKLIGNLTYNNGFNPKFFPVCEVVLGETSIVNASGTKQGSFAEVINCDELPTKMAWYQQFTKTK